MRTRTLILATLCLASFLISVDVTIVNVALPTLVRDLGASTTDLQWIVDAYSLVFAAFVLAAGSLSDRFGRKGALLAGLAVFAGGSAGGAIAGSTAELIAFRAVMGLGAALMFPSTLSLLVNVFTERTERARAIGLWGATTGIGIATGPIVGGWLLERFWWGSIFAFLAAVALVIGLLVMRFVPTSRDLHAPSLDRRGLAVSSAAMAVLILGMIQAPEWGWGSPGTLACIGFGLAGLGLFVFIEKRSPHPMLDVALFRNPRFTAASASVAISFFALQGFIFLITQYFQFVKSYAPLGTGVRLLPVAGSVAVTSVAGTKLAVRVGNKAVVASGLVLFAAGLAWTSTATAGTSYVTIVAQMILLGSGMGLTSAPATEAIMGAVPVAKAGVGSAVNDATRLFGGTLGVAVIGSVSASLYSSRLSSTLPGGLPAAAAGAAKGSIGGAHVASGVLSHLGFQHLSTLLSGAATDAFLHSLSGGCLVAAGVALGGAAVAAGFLPARPKREPVAAASSSVGRPPPAVPAPTGSAGGRAPQGVGEAASA
jgi:EmrB/QacA subfamily drug resistance transporter